MEHRDNFFCEVNENQLEKREKGFKIVWQYNLSSPNNMF
jgi:hypothetical protein